MIYCHDAPRAEFSQLFKRDAQQQVRRITMHFNLSFFVRSCDTGNDNTLEYQCDSNSATQDFHLNAFRILNSPNAKVFFLCDVIVCLKTANSSICKDRCDNCTNPGQGGGRRRRAAEEDRDIDYDPGSKTYSLSMGPFSVKESDGKGL